MYLFKLVSLSEFVAASQLLCSITYSYLLFSLDHPYIALAYFELYQTHPRTM